METLAYQIVPASGIERALQRLFPASADPEKEGYRISADRNFIVLTTKARLPEIDRMLEDFAVSIPSRFFVVYEDPALRELQTSVAGRCQIVSRGRHLCCEMVRLACPKVGAALLPNVLRANLLTGKQTELLVGEQAVSSELLELVRPIADRLFLNSADVPGGLATVRRLNEDLPIVDVQWLFLSAWRDQVKSVFSHDLLIQQLDALEEISIAAPSDGAGVLPAGALLLAGWISSRLHLTPMSYGSSGFVCQSPVGEPVHIRVRSDASAPRGQVQKLLLKFRRQGSSEAHIELRHGERLETFVEAGQRYHVSRVLDDETVTGALRRYFVIGESTTNYRSALRFAVELDNLPQASNML